jgi:glycosyltransferase involved in cell wall biosynthesis
LGRHLSFGDVRRNQANKRGNIGPVTAPLVWFYPHGVLRERQLDVIRGWPRGRVLNPELAEKTPGALAGTGARPTARRTGLLGRLPLPNVKRRPSALPPDSAIYLFGGVVDRGPFVIDLDTPYALTGYNLAALPLWRGLLRRMLLSPRCLAIRCMSEACRRSLTLEFGPAAGAKSEVHYPQIAQAPAAQTPRALREAWDGPRFLFVGTQFEIKGGAALLRAFHKVHAAVPTARLDVVTHLPAARFALAEQLGVAVHPASLDRAALWQRFFSQADVLVLPTFVESFGMVALEALAHGLAVVATDLYALPEMVKDGVNGALLHAPLSIWDGYRPGRLYRALDTVPEAAARLETTAFELDLATAMIRLCDRATLASAQTASRHLYEEHFVR